ncbi:MAG: hypothetical protein QM669_11440 [Siphonobacter sp.]
MLRGLLGSIEGSEIYIRSHRIPISRNYRDEVLNKVLTDKLWKN